MSMPFSSNGFVSRGKTSADRGPKPFCECKQGNGPFRLLDTCNCGEDEVKEWKWESPVNNSWLMVSDNQTTVTFHPFYSSGTASVKGDTAMTHNNHYYWEVKMLTDTYGTDIMVGMCSDKAALHNSQFEFKSLLGQDSESYGLSYKGEVRHQATVTKDSVGFCRGSIVGVRVDMWAGTMEFYVNRKSQGISFYNLRRHNALFPMLCSTAAQSSMRLMHAASWQASLQLEALKTLNAAAGGCRRLAIPPGLRRALQKQPWLNIGGDETRDTTPDTARAADVLSEVLPSQYVNGFYVDNVERHYRMVLWE